MNTSSFQNARAVDIIEILKDPSILIDELKAKIQEIEVDVKNGATALLDKAKNIVADAEAEIAATIAKGTEAAQCVSENKAQLETLASQGGTKSN